MSKSPHAALKAGVKHPRSCDSNPGTPTAARVLPMFDELLPCVLRVIGQLAPTPQQRLTEGCSEMLVISTIHKWTRNKERKEKNRRQKKAGQAAL